MSKMKKENLIGLGIGSPGSVDLDGGTVKYPPNFPNWTVVRLGEEVSKGLDNIKVAVDNDANVAAVGEGKFGAGKGTSNFFLFTLGTGIGGGIIINDQIYRGPTGAAGELGHISIDYNGPECLCGNKGCIEAYVGQKYLSKRTVEQLKNHPDSKILEIVNGDLEKVEPLVIYQAAKAGDKFASEVLEEAGFYLGIAAATIFNIFDFHLAVIGGGVSAAGDLLFNSIKKTARERVLSVHRDRIQIVPALLGNKAGLLGAAGMVL
jgi:glucokinase